MSVAKRKGTSYETLSVGYLNEYGFNTERRALAGSQDKGDIAGVDNWVFECKAQRKHELASWMDELQQEIKNANSKYGVLFVKRPNRAVSKSYAIMTMEQFVQIISVLEERQRRKNAKKNKISNN